MAAASKAQATDILELRLLSAADLEPILEEEVTEWRQLLDWDFRPSAELVRRYVGTRTLTGLVLAGQGRPVGYCYYVVEGHRGLLGDLHVLGSHRTQENVNRLLGETVRALMADPFVRRIEAQLMMLDAPLERSYPAPGFLAVHLRNFMLAELYAAHRLPAGAAGRRVRIEPWSSSWHEEAARLLAASYRGHVDAEINDQYRSPAGASHFLTHIVRYPGCGTFFQPASYLAFSPGPDRLSGMSLASLVAPEVGHITQICVSPEVKGTGVGYELLRKSMTSLAAHGCRKVSLTVTSANAEAVRLYERVGFRTIHQFAACVWQGFR